MASTTSVNRAAGAASETVMELISGPVRPAVRIAAFPSALYLRLSTGDVIALLSRGAVRMPFGLVLASSSADFPLDGLGGPLTVGASEVRAGPWSVRVSRRLPVTAPVGLEPDPTAVDYAQHRLDTLECAAADQVVADIRMRVGPIRQLDDGLAHRMMGAGPGLTPAGDDFLAGLLVGAWSFGLVADPLRAAVLARAPELTTEVSAALLRCACRGESLPELTSVLLSLAGRQAALDRALAALVQIGHTSGRALAAGVVRAAAMCVAPCGTGSAGRTSQPNSVVGR